MSTRRLVSASTANLLIPLTGLLVSPFLSRELGPEGRGLYAALTLPIVVCGWFGTFGLQDALSYHLRSHKLSRRAAATVGLAATLPLGSIGVGLLALLGLLVIPAGHYGQFLTLTLLAPLHVLANLLIGALTGASDITGLNLVKVVPALLRTALVIVACLMFDLSAYGASLIFVASMAIGIPIGLLRMRRRAADGPVGLDTAPVPTRSLVRYALVCLPGVLASISSARLDQMIGAPVIGLEQLGYYAVAVSVAEIPMVIATAARSVLMGRPDTDDPRRSSMVGRLAVLASVSACGLLAATAPFGVPFVFGDAFGPAVPATLILCAATTLYTCMVILSAALLATDQPGASSRALVTGSVVSIGLLFLLARWGAVGAAVASLGGYGVSMLMCTIAVRNTPGYWTPRMLTVPYRDDLTRLVAKVRNMRGQDPDPPDDAPDLADAPTQVLPVTPPYDVADAPTEVLRTPVAPAPIPGGHRRQETLRQRIADAVVRGRALGWPTLGAGALIVLAWLRVQLPQLVQLVTTGRPEFNSRVDDAPAVSAVLGDAISLGFLLVAATLVVRGLLERRMSRPVLLAVVVAPLVALEVSALLNGEPTGIVSVALPLAALAVWLQPPGRAVLATIGVTGAVTAAGSLVIALARPDLGLLTGTDAGSKSGFLGGLLVGSYPHSNVLGITLALCLPFVFCIRTVLTRRVSLAIVLVALFWTGSRTSQLAAVVVIATYVVLRLSHSWWQPERDRPGRTTVLAVALSVPAAAGLAMIVLVPILTDDPDAFTRRGRIWSVLLDRWTDQPWLGNGPKIFQDPQLVAQMGGQFTHGHNLMVQLLATGGLVATLLFAALLAAAGRGALGLARTGWLPGALFVVALVHASWLEASHLVTTLAGYVTWLPLMLLVRLGADATGMDDPGPAYRSTSQPSHPSSGGDADAGRSPQKITVARR